MDHITWRVYSVKFTVSLCELIAQNFVSISFLIARNPERSGPLGPDLRDIKEILFLENISISLDS